MGELFYQIAALLILALFYGCYLVKLLMQKQEGIQTNQMGKGKRGIVKWIEVILRDVTFIVPVVELLSIFSLKQMPAVSLRIAGILIGLIGDAVFIIAVKTMKDSWRAGVSETDKTDLVTAGIYQYSRNPAFLGFDLVYAGILCMYFNWNLLIISAFGAMMFHLQIVRVEEEFLLRTFGNKYSDYCNHVNRYVGRK